MNEPLVFIEELRRRFYIKNGDLYRRAATGGRPADEVAGWVTVCGVRPYRKVSFKNRALYVHHVVYLLVHGELPEVVDHINGDSLDNRVENLRGGSQSQNMANARIGRANTSGFKGVTWHARAKKWAAQITVNGKCIYLGCYSSKDEAANAYAVGSKKHFGEFARVR